MSEKATKTPQIRFDGYTDAWEERKFFESIASTIDFRGRTPKKLGMDWSDSGYLALSALNVKNGYIDPLADAHYGDEKLYRKWMSGRELKKGQVLFTTEAPMGNVAQVPDDNGYILSQRTVAFETKEDMMTNDFLAVLLKSPLVFNNLSALSSGGTAKGVSQKSLKGLSITVPLDIDEQQKIGSFFKQLDETIALHQRECDLLAKMKKSYLQKMFPKNGEDKPEIRFDGYTDAWEQRKVDDVTTSYSGGTPQAGNSEYYNGTIPFIRSGEIYESHTELFITEKGLENSSAKMVSKGDILYALYGATSGEVSRSNIDGAINQAILAITPNDGYNANFLVEWFRKEKESIIDKYLQGGQGNLSAQIIKKLEIPFPTFEEQNEIGRYFTEINHLITLHQRELDSLKKMKKSLLQMMFV